MVTVDRRVIWTLFWYVDRVAVFCSTLPGVATTRPEIVMTTDLSFSSVKLLLPAQMTCDVDGVQISLGLVVVAVTLAMSRPCVPSTTESFSALYLGLGSPR